MFQVIEFLIEDGFAKVLRLVARVQSLSWHPRNTFIQPNPTGQLEYTEAHHHHRTYCRRQKHLAPRTL